MDISTQHCVERKAKVPSFLFRVVSRISYILLKSGSDMLIPRDLSRLSPHWSNIPNLVHHVTLVYTLDACRSMPWLQILPNFADINIM